MNQILDIVNIANTAPSVVQSESVAMAVIALISAGLMSILGRRGVDEKTLALIYKTLNRQIVQLESQLAYLQESHDEIEDELNNTKNILSITETRLCLANEELRKLNKTPKKIADTPLFDYH